MNNMRLSEARDIPILNFIWRWKVTTTSVLALKFFSKNQNPTRAYNRLRELSLGGFLQSKQNETGQIKVWTLTQLGFSVIKDRLPNLREVGFKSENLKHDYIVTGTHLGNWLASKPDFCADFTEQELRRYSLDFYPAWIPQSQDHRPDGYWHISNSEGRATFALEVELTSKRLEDYATIGRFYNKCKMINRVLWVVQNPATGARIHKALLESQSVSREIHNFTTLESVLSCGWNAPFICGPEKGKTMASLLPSLERAVDVQRACTCTPVALFDSRIRSFHSSL